MEQLIKYLNNLWTQTIAPTLKSSWDKADKRTDRLIESVRDDISINNPNDISNPIVEAQNATTEAIRAIPEVNVPELDLSSIEAKLDSLKSALEQKEMTVNVGKTDVNVDMKPVIQAIEKIKLEVPKMERQEVIDYTLILDEICVILEKPKDFTEIKKVQELLKPISKTEDIAKVCEYIQVLIDKPIAEFPEIPMHKGRIKVEVDRVGGGGGGGLTSVESEALQGVATEAKQDEMINSNYPSGTASNGTLTLTNADTAYSITAPTSNYVLIVYNGSDTDMYMGYATLTIGGILLPAGGTMNFNLGANQTIYFYCTSAGKVLNYSLKEI